MKRPDKRGYDFGKNVEACQYAVDMNSYCDYLENKLEVSEQVGKEKCKHIRQRYDPAPNKNKCCDCGELVLALMPAAE